MWRQSAIDPSTSATLCCRQSTHPLLTAPHAAWSSILIPYPYPVVGLALQTQWHLEDRGIIILGESVCGALGAEGRGGGGRGA